MRWAHAFLFSAVILTCAAFAWSQSGPDPVAAPERSVVRHVPRSGSLVRHTGEAVPGDMADRLIEVAEDVDGAMANRLRRMRERDPVAFEQAMQTTGRRLMGIAELKVRDPRLYQLKLLELKADENVLRAARRLRESIETGSGDVDHRRKELRENLQIQVAVSIGGRSEYLARLREHAEKLEAEIDRDVRRFEKTVESRLDELVRGDAPVADVIPDE